MQANTLSDLRTRCKERFDVGASGFITDAEWNRLINEAGAHLHNLIVAQAEDLIVKTYTLTTASTTSGYALPSDLFKVLQVWYRGSNYNSPASYSPLPRLMKQEFRGGSGLAGYLIVGQQIYLSAPSAASVEIWYAPHYTALVNDSDIMDVSVVPGWDEFVVNQAVIQAKIKEEADIGSLMAVQNTVRQMIQECLANRDLGQVGRVVDVTNVALDIY